MADRGVTLTVQTCARCSGPCSCPSLPRVAEPVLVADVARLLDTWYPPAWAESWDAVGPVCGDPAEPVRRVLLAVDPVQGVADEAVAWDADLLVVHHPLLLRAVHSVAATTPKGRLVHTLVRNGIALHVCHTNADSPPGGVSEALANAVGVDDPRPLETDPADPLDKLVVFVPREELEPLVDALAAAGAGALGDYDRCTFVTDGTGSFRPLPGAHPTIGRVGEVEQVEESRLEMVLPRDRRTEVLAAMRAAHPYEEPAYDLLELADVPGERGSGRIGRLAEPLSLRAFSERVAAALPATGSAIRVAGDPGRRIDTVAVCGGAGDFLLDRARASGADVYVTSDLRHHPVSELREHAVADPSTPALVDVPHAAAEWTWLPVLAERLRHALGPTTVEVRVSQTSTDPWTYHLPMTPPTAPPTAG
jgi:dinuclear metal center YbgI/SA1388 family protein